MENSIVVQNDFLVINGKPTFLFGGDLSYCRVPRRSWKKRILQMKAAGLNTICVYIVWCYHQPTKDKMGFEGEKDLPLFLKTIKECGMYCIFRMGPFVHGEYRNGGLPQWLVDELGEKVRTNAPEYLDYAKAWYEKLIQIVKPYLITAGGPVIILQLENELGSAGCKGDDLARGSASLQENTKHLLFYYDLIRKNGIDLPLLDINKIDNKEELLKPLIDGGGMYPASCFYCDGDVPAFSDEWRKQHIHPSITIETGGGMFIRFYDTPPYRNTNSVRGPIINPAMVELMVAKHIGEGCSGVNLYIFCDGQNPDGCGEHGLPERNMNYQAPISAVGRFRSSYWKLKRIGWFLRSFQQELLKSTPDMQWAKVHSCGIPFPGTYDGGDLFSGYGQVHTETAAEESHALQSIARVTTGLNLSESNFLIIRNYNNGASQWQRDVRILTSPSHLASEVWQEYPKKIQLDLPPDTTKIMPFFIRIAPAYFLEYSTAELLDRRITHDGKTQIILCESEETMAEICLVHPEGCIFNSCNSALLLKESPCMTTLIARAERTPTVIEGEKIRIILVTKEYGEHLWDAGDECAWSNANLSGNISELLCETEQEDFAMELFTAYPPKLTSGLQYAQESYDEKRHIYRLIGKLDIPQRKLEWRRSIHEGNLILTAELPTEILDDVDDIVLTINHQGTFAQAYLDETLVSDHAYGRFLPWEISLRDLPHCSGTLRLVIQNAVECTIAHNTQVCKKFLFNTKCPL